MCKDIDRRKSKYLEKCQSLRLFVHHKIPVTITTTTTTTTMLQRRNGEIILLEEWRVSQGMP